MFVFSLTKGANKMNCVSLDQTLEWVNLLSRVRQCASCSVCVLSAVRLVRCLVRYDLVVHLVRCPASVSSPPIKRRHKRQKCKPSSARQAHSEYLCEPAETWRTPSSRRICICRHRNMWIMWAGLFIANGRLNRLVLDSQPANVVYECVVFTD